MKALYCDVCKNAIEKPISERTYFHIADYDICESCKEDLDRASRFTLRGKKPFDYHWYNDMTLAIIKEGTVKKRIEVKSKR